MYEVSCRDLGVTDCEFDLMAYSLERPELDILAHAATATPVSAPQSTPTRTRPSAALSDGASRLLPTRSPRSDRRRPSSPPAHTHLALRSQTRRTRTSCHMR